MIAHCAVVPVLFHVRFNLNEDYIFSVLAFREPWPVVTKKEVSYVQVQLSTVEVGNS